MVGQQEDQREAEVRQGLLVVGVGVRGPVAEGQYGPYAGGQPQHEAAPGVEVWGWGLVTVALQEDAGQRRGHHARPARHHLPPHRQLVGGLARAVEDPAK